MTSVYMVYTHFRGWRTGSDRLHGVFAELNQAITVAREIRKDDIEDGSCQEDTVVHRIPVHSTHQEFQNNGINRDQVWPSVKGEGK